jgi:hypothetical protein
MLRTIWVNYVFEIGSKIIFFRKILLSVQVLFINQVERFVSCRNTVEQLFFAIGPEEKSCTNNPPFPLEIVILFLFLFVGSFVVITIAPAIAFFPYKVPEVLTNSNNPSRIKTYSWR